jgi:hypothetical protein
VQERANGSGKQIGSAPKYSLKEGNGRRVLSWRQHIVRRQVKIRLHLLRSLISAGNGASNLTRLHNAVPNNAEQKRGE